MKLSRLFSAIFIFLIPTFSNAQSWKKYPYTPTGSLISFPKDEGVHGKEPLEWWYTVGHLIGETTGKHYSYMLTYFHYPVAVFDGFRIFNVSNDDAGKFYPATTPINFTTLAKDSLNLQVKLYGGDKDSWTNKIGSDGKSIPYEYSIAAISKSTALQLDYVSLKTPLILADSGLFNQGANNYTYYYSQTSNAVTGTITLEGINEKVSGTSWIDRQYGSFNPYSGEKYEWFSLQLSNGMDLNLYNIFTNDNRTPDILAYKTMGVYKDENTQFTTSQFKLERFKFRYTSDSVNCYSSAWHLTSAGAGIDIYFDAPHPDYEVTSPFRFYEGPVKILGTVNGQSITGKGFAELLHAYQKPVAEFSKDVFSPNVPVAWKLINPDQARQVRYDLSYSTDKLKYSQIAVGTPDTSYLWLQVPETKYYLKLKAYSIDSTLVSFTDIEIDPALTSLANPYETEETLLYAINNEVSIALKNKNNKLELSIADLEGKTHIPKFIVKDKSVVVNVNSLQAGMYILRLNTGSQMQTFKIILD